jgi:hypothetical protein
MKSVRITCYPENWKEIQDLQSGVQARLNMWRHIEIGTAYEVFWDRRFRTWEWWNRGST